MKDYLYLAGLAALAGIAAWLYFGGEHKGIAKCEAKDTAAVAQHEIHETKADTDALTQQHNENKRLNDLLAATPAPRLIVRLRDAPACPAGPSAPNGNSLPTSPAGPDPGVRPADSLDIGPRVRLLGTVGEFEANDLRACQTRSAALAASAR